MRHQKELNMSNIPYKKIHVVINPSALRASPRATRKCSSWSNRDLRQGDCETRRLGENSSQSPCHRVTLSDGIAIKRSSVLGHPSRRRRKSFSCSSCSCSRPGSIGDDISMVSSCARYLPRKERLRESAWQRQYA